MGAESLGFRAVGIGTAPVVTEHPATVADTPRYRDMAARAAGIVDDQYVNGLHVHVEVPAGSRGEGSEFPASVAAAVHRDRREFPDVAGARQRLRQLAGHPLPPVVGAGIPPCFAGINDYDLRLKRMLATDVVLDCGHIAWAARLSDTYPTIEVRASDTQLEAKDSVLIALLIRAVVGAELEDPAQPDGVADPEMLDIALWKAARDGLGGELIDPGDGVSRPAEEIVGVLNCRTIIRWSLRPMPPHVPIWPRTWDWAGAAQGQKLLSKRESPAPLAPKAGKSGGKQPRKASKASRN